ncbi:MAG: acyltransferase [Actinomycetota bacterium]
MRQIWRQETGAFDLCASLACGAARLIPGGAGGRLRARIYRALGMQVAPGNTFAGALTLGSSPGSLRRIRFGRCCFINSHVYIDAAAPVTVGDGVAIGHHVVIITTDHAVGPPHHRAGDLRCVPVTIEDGAWIAAGVTLLPGVTVGAGAVVAAGAVVTKDVPPNVLAGGVPARVIRQLDDAEPRTGRTALYGVNG